MTDEPMTPQRLAILKAKCKDRHWSNATKIQVGALAVAYERAVKALRPFARAYWSRPHDTDWRDETRLRLLLQGDELTWGDIRAAAVIVAEYEGEGVTPE